MPRRKVAAENCLSVAIVDLTMQWLGIVTIDRNHRTHAGPDVSHQDGSYCAGKRGSTRLMRRNRRFATFLQWLSSSLPDYFASASRFCLAQSLPASTAFIGGPPSLPHAQGPSIFASVMHEQDLSLMHAHT